MLTNTKQNAMLRGAYYMREKIARAIAQNPRPEMREVSEHIRHNIKLPSKTDVDYAAKKWMDSELEREILESYINDTENS